MEEPDPDAWTDSTTGRDRVRAVAELLDSPATVDEVRRQADVAWNTAKTELERLEAENIVETVTVDGDEQYRVNQVRLLFDEIQRVITTNDRQEIEAEIESMAVEAEQLQEEFDVESLDALRDRLTRDLSAEEIRQTRNAISTWEALEADLRLYRHALQLYDDVSRLEDGDGPAEVAP